MSLTGLGLPMVLGLIALLCFGALVVDVPGRRLRAPWPVAVRGATALLLVAASLLGAGALLNNEYAFYTSWSDLLGHEGPSSTLHNGTTAAAAAARPQSGPLSTVRPPRRLPALPSPHERLQTVTVTGATSGVRTKVLVWLPRGYNPAAHRRYPVIMALHGFPGRPSSNLKYVQLNTALDKLTAEHKIAPSILVMPQINTPETYDTECLNIPGGPQIETWLSQDVPDWVVTHFRASTERSAWATFGYSFGGYCSAFLGIRHPGTFGASIVLQGYFAPTFAPEPDPIPGGQKALAQYDLAEIAHRDPPAMALWVLTSKGDPISYPSSMTLLKQARAPMSVTADVLPTGGHRAAVFVPRIPRALTWLGTELPGFRATTT